LYNFIGGNLLQKTLKEGYRRVLAEIYDSLIKKKEKVDVNKLAEKLGIDWETLAIYIKHLNDHGYINAKFLYGNPTSKIADVRILKVTPLGRNTIENS
jgi:DNA-binding MarR family transcriptional regulator